MLPSMLYFSHIYIGAKQTRILFPLRKKYAWHGSKQKCVRHDEYSLRIKERKQLFIAIGWAPKSEKVEENYWEGLGPEATQILRFWLSINACAFDKQVIVCKHFISVIESVSVSGDEKLYRVFYFRKRKAGIDEKFRLFCLLPLQLLLKTCYTMYIWLLSILVWSLLSPVDSRPSKVSTITAHLD